MNEDWRGTRFEFHDGKVQDVFAALRENAQGLANLTNEHLYAFDTNLALCSPKTDVDRRQGLQPSTQKAIGLMNDKATAFAASIDAFERTARDRIRIAQSSAAVAAAVATLSDPRDAARELLGRLGTDDAFGRLPGIVSRPSLIVRLVPIAVAERRRLDAGLVGKAQLRFPPDSLVRVAADSDGNQWWSIGELYDVGNPFARHPLPRAMLPEATHWMEIDGKMDCLPYYVTSILWSKSLIMDRDDPMPTYETIPEWFETLARRRAERHNADTDRGRPGPVD